MFQSKDIFPLKCILFQLELFSNLLKPFGTCNDVSVKKRENNLINPLFYVEKNLKEHSVGNNCWLNTPTTQPSVIHYLLTMGSQAPVVISNDLKHLAGFSAFFFLSAEDSITLGLWSVSGLTSMVNKASLGLSENAFLK